jgi:C4-dicarboxylate-specific signal transduction histidine kinase
VRRSLDELRDAYGQLERNQTTLMRSERLATLGRLAAGIAHEVNTPLGAVITELRLLAELGAEYEQSIDDATVTGQDHHAIAHDIRATVDNAGRWARKAAAVVSRVKLHGREPRPIDSRPFLVSAVVTETADLLGHRLRTASCELSFTEEPPGVAITGDPTRLSQVLLNLVGNAIDAYEDQGAAEGRVAVSARAADGTVTIEVRDWAGGMPPEVAARAFEDLFTTKVPGRGTGLGLWISRNLVEESFGGTLTVETRLGAGSCFTIAVPQAEAARVTAPLAG